VRDGEIFHVLLFIQNVGCSGCADLCRQAATRERRWRAARLRAMRRCLVMLQKEWYPKALGPTVRRVVLSPASALLISGRIFFSHVTVEIDSTVLNQ
jgi:hypothetical protein